MTTTKNKKKIYIAGPMTGLPNLNAQAFFYCAATLQDAGCIVLNPASLPKGLTEEAYMDICLAMVRAADSIWMLEGWEQSDGAQTEYRYAKKLGLNMFGHVAISVTPTVTIMAGAQGVV